MATPAMPTSQASAGAWLSSRYFTMAPHSRPVRSQSRTVPPTDRAARGQPRADALGARVGEEERGLLRRQDREPLLVGGQEPSQRRVGRLLRRVLPPGRDQLHLARERPDGGVLERAPREERARGDGHDERHDHGRADPEEEPRPKGHRGTSL